MSQSDENEQSEYDPYELIEIPGVDGTLCTMLLGEALALTRVGHVENEQMSRKRYQQIQAEVRADGVNRAIAWRWVTALDNSLDSADEIAGAPHA